MNFGQDKQKPSVRDDSKQKRENGEDNQNINNIPNPYSLQNSINSNNPIKSINVQTTQINPNGNTKTMFPVEDKKIITPT